MSSDASSATHATNTAVTSATNDAVTKYTFPILSNEDVMFAVMGARITCAQLFLNGDFISSLNVEASGQKKMIPLDFLGGKPLRCNLLTFTSRTVVIYSDDDEHPQIMYSESAPTQILMADAPFAEKVTVYDGDESHETILVYVNGMATFEAVSAE